jgi:hypothetical protein
MNFFVLIACIRFNTFQEINCYHWQLFNSVPVASIVAASSSIGTTTLSWVSARSTVVEHSQQEGFIECRCQRQFKPPNLKENQGFGEFQLSPQEAPSV